MGTFVFETSARMCLLLVLVGYVASAQTIRYVATTGTNTNPATATSWATSTTNLQGAIEASAPGDAVWVAQGTYLTTTTQDPTIAFAMKDGVSLYGGFIGTETSLSSRVLTASNASVLSGDIGIPGNVDDNSYHVFVNARSLSLATLLDGFIITGGNANQTNGDSGGGILNGTSANLTIRNCTFRANRASEVNGLGGAIYGQANLRLLNCSFEGNTARFGGAVMLTSIGGPKSGSYVNCSFQANAAADGGAAFCFGAALSVINCSFQQNTGFSTGGALTAQNGNGTTSSVTLANCVLWNNGSTNSLNRLSGTFLIRHSLSEASTFTNGSLTTGPGNLTATTSPFVSTSRTNLPPCSPANNAGDVASYTAINGPATDLAGNPRIRNGQIDMGAFEAVPVTRLYVDDNAVGRATGLSWTDAFLSLQTALTYPCSGELTEIWVAGGVYRPTTTGPDSRTISFRMRDGLAIIGSFAGTETSLSDRALSYASGMVNPTSTLSGDIGAGNTNTDNSYHVVLNASSMTETAVLDGFRITGGNANASSGLNQNGAGMANVDKSSPSLRNCVFEANLSVGQGGGLFNSSLSNPRLTNCVFRSNTAVAEGGAINNQLNSNPSMANCAFIGNTSFYGGAITSFNSTATLTNCSFLDNIATLGWAIYSNGGSNALINSIVWGSGGANTIGHTGGASTTVQYGLFQPATLTAAGIVSGPGNLTTSTTPFATSTSPQLTACALAINAGAPTTTTAIVGTLDLAGSPRFFGQGSPLGRIDMGAVEFQSVPGPIQSVQSGSWQNPGTWSCGRIPLLTDSVWLKHAVLLPPGTTGTAFKLRYDSQGNLSVGVGSRLKVGF